MDFSFSTKTKQLQSQLLQFMDEHIYPSEATYAAELTQNTAAGKRWSALATVENLKLRAQEAGLWNLFLPVDSAEASGYHGAGLTNLEYAPLAEIMGRVLGRVKSSIARRQTRGTWRPSPVTVMPRTRRSGCGRSWMEKSVQLLR